MWCNDREGGKGKTRGYHRTSLAAVRAGGLELWMRKSDSSLNVAIIVKYIVHREHSQLLCLSKDMIVLLAVHCLEGSTGRQD